MPRRAKQNKRAILRGRVTQELKDRALDYCVRKGMSEATLLRLAVIEFLDRQEIPSAPGKLGPFAHHALNEDPPRKSSKGYHTGVSSKPLTEAQRLLKKAAGEED